MPPLTFVPISALHLHPRYQTGHDAVHGHRSASAHTGLLRRGIQRYFASAHLVFQTVGLSPGHRRSSLTSRNAALREAASEITTGVIGADDVYSSLSTLGCDWQSITVIQVDDASVFLHARGQG